jgi:hypothetical protein
VRVCQRGAGEPASVRSFKGAAALPRFVTAKKGNPAVRAPRRPPQPTSRWRQIGSQRPIWSRCQLATVNANRSALDGRPPGSFTKAVEPPVRTLATASRRLLNHAKNRSPGITLADLQSFAQFLNCSGLAPISRIRTLAAVKNLFGSAAGKLRTAASTRVASRGCFPTRPADCRPRRREWRPHHRTRLGLRDYRRGWSHSLRRMDWR